MKKDEYKKLRDEAKEHIARAQEKMIKAGCINILDGKTYANMAALWDSCDNGIAYEWDVAICIIQNRPRTVAQAWRDASGRSANATEPSIEFAATFFYKNGRNPSGVDSHTPFMSVSYIRNGATVPYIEVYSPSGLKVISAPKTMTMQREEIINELLSFAETFTSATTPVKIGDIYDAHLLKMGRNGKGLHKQHKVMDALELLH